MKYLIFLMIIPFIAFEHTGTENPASPDELTVKPSVESYTVASNTEEVWDTRKIESGVYFYLFKISGIDKSGKIVISK